MSNELSNLILVFDSREKSEKRIKYVKDWFESQGGLVEKAALPLCDYKIVGEFHDISVNLGVEFKTMSDFCSSWQDLKNKLGRARNELYEEVALCIDSGNYTYTYQDGKAFIHNPAIRNGDADVCPLAVYEGLIDTLQQSGIHCRQLRSEAQFPDSLYNLLTYITNDHELIGFTGKGYILAYRRTLQTLEGIGTKTVDKLIASYPNMHWLSSASEESLIEVIGKKSGSKLYNFLHCRELETDEWRNGHHLDGTEKYKTICGQDCYNPQHCDAKCVKHPDYNKILSKKQQDNEGRLAFDAPAKNPVKCNCGHVFHAVGLVECPVCHKRLTIKSCDFADPKKHAECKTPDHFKNSSHSGKDINSVKHSQIYHPSLPDDKLNGHEVRGSFKEAPHMKSLPFTSDNSRVGKPEPSHVAHNHKTAGLNPAPASKSSSISSSHVPNAHDTSSHPSTNSIPPSPKLGDPQSLPPKNGTAVKQGVLSVPPAETHEDKELNIGLDDKLLECVVKCRACHQVIIPEQDDDTGFCHDPDCIKIRKEPSLENKLRIFLRKPHTVEEIVEEYGCTAGYTFQVCINNVKAGNLKKVTEQNGRTTFQRII